MTIYLDPVAIFTFVIVTLIAGGLLQQSGVEYALGKRWEWLVLAAVFFYMLAFLMVAISTLAAEGRT